MNIRKMLISDYDKVYVLWMSCSGMGLNNLDDSRDGIDKCALVVFEKNENGNAFWEKLGFTVREDLIYRNKTITEMIRIDT